MLIITKESVRSLKDRLRDSRNVEWCKAELKKMLDIKEALSWRADCASGCCCIGWELPARLASEVEILEEILALVEENKSTEAISILEDYIAWME
jgi:hypothetical protein